IIQAPMVGASLDGLALAVSGAGGLGTYAIATLAPAEIGPAIAAMRAATDAPFGVNLLMAPKTTPEAAVVDAALARLAPWSAAGGIMDGRGVAAALALGAAAVQMGTAFLLADEAVTSRTWRRAVETAGDDPTRLTRAFTGRHARGIENRFIREMQSLQDEVPA